MKKRKKVEVKRRKKEKQREEEKKRLIEGKGKGDRMEGRQEWRERERGDKKVMKRE